MYCIFIADFISIKFHVYMYSKYHSLILDILLLNFGKEYRPNSGLNIQVPLLRGIFNFV